MNLKFTSKIRRIRRRLHLIPFTFLALSLTSCVPLPEKDEIERKYDEIIETIMGRATPALPWNDISIPDISDPDGGQEESKKSENDTAPTPYTPQKDDIPPYQGKMYIYLSAEGFKAADAVYMTFSPLDSLGRCGAAEGLLGPETIAKAEDRGEIGSVKPAGFRSVKYPDLIDDLYLWNRCHLLGYQLTGENANELNLTTGTRQFNVETGMEKYENEVASYIRMTKNHVYYRVTPIYDGDNLVCKGVKMEARSKEDNGSGIDFCVFVYNVQDGIWISYKTGESCRESEKDTEQKLLLNESSMKYHFPGCTKAGRSTECITTLKTAIENGYGSCSWCQR